MLYVRTGSNGACKSLFTLKDVRDKQLAEKRPVCVLIGKPAVGGAPADPERRYVKIYPKIMEEFGWVECHFSEWWSQPDGTIFLGDECHNWLPRRPNGSAVPEYVAKLAEHRSRGFDFFLLTQHPSNLDTFVTKIVGPPGWHQHLKRVFGASNATRVLQWDAVKLDCEKDGSGKAAQITTRVQPKDVYGWYESAQMHTGKRRIPKQVWIFLGSLVLVVLLGWFAATKLLGLGTKHAPAQPDGGAVQGLVTGAPASGGRQAPATAAEYVASYKPRLSQLMHTAPAYDDLTKPKRVPVPAACVTMKSKGCKCYTQDGTPYPTDVAMCMQIVSNGLFLAFQAEGEQSKERSQSAQLRGEPVSSPVAASAGPVVFGGLPQAAPALPAPAEPLPQRIASVRR